MVEKAKIIQIAVCVEGDGEEHLYALCSDGTLWKRYALYGGGWKWGQVKGPIS